MDARIIHYLPQYCEVSALAPFSFFASLEFPDDLVVFSFGSSDYVAVVMALQDSFLLLFLK